MRGLKKNCTQWHRMTDRQTHRHTHGHGDSKTNSAKRAELVKIIFQLRTKIHFKIKTHLLNIYMDIICDECMKAESTTRHTLECAILLGKNEIVTYLPLYEDIYGDDEYEQAYTSRLLRDNLGRLPH